MLPALNETAYCCQATPQCCQGGNCQSEETSKYGCDLTCTKNATGRPFTNYLCTREDGYQVSTAYPSGLLAVSRQLQVTQDINPACGDFNNTCNSTVWTTTAQDKRFIVGIEDFTVMFDNVAIQMTEDVLEDGRQMSGYLLVEA